MKVCRVLERFACNVSRTVLRRYCALSGVGARACKLGAGNTGLS